MIFIWLKIIYHLYIEFAVYTETACMHDVVYDSGWVDMNNNERNWLNTHIYKYLIPLTEYVIVCFLSSGWEMKEKKPKTKTLKWVAIRSDRQWEREEK